MGRELGLWLFAAVALIIAGACLLYFRHPADAPIPYWENVLNQALDYLP